MKEYDPENVRLTLDGKDISSTFTTPKSLFIYKDIESVRIHMSRCGVIYGDINTYNDKILSTNFININESKAEWGVKSKTLYKYIRFAEDSNFTGNEINLMLSYYKEG